MKLVTHLFLQQWISLLSSELKSDLPMQNNNSNMMLLPKLTQCLRKCTLVSYMQYQFLHVPGCFTK